MQNGASGSQNPEAPLFLFAKNEVDRLLDGNLDAAAGLAVLVLHGRGDHALVPEFLICVKYAFAKNAIYANIGFAKNVICAGETGSLISIRKKTEGILIPSEEDRINLYPMDFEEFLWAIGNKP